MATVLFDTTLCDDATNDDVSEHGSAPEWMPQAISHNDVDPFSTTANDGDYDELAVIQATTLRHDAVRMRRTRCAPRS